MAGYIGELGRMHKILWPTPVKVTNPTRYEVQSAPSRRWAFVTTPAWARRREWSLDVSGTNREVTGLVQLVAGAFGSGPWRFISDEAAVTNVLTPAESMLAGIANGGYVDGVGGPAAASCVGGGEVVIAQSVPVPAGSPVTVSVDTTGGTVLTLQPVNAAGRPVGNARVERAQRQVMHRLQVTIPVFPAAAVALKITASGYTTLCLPQVVWLDSCPRWDMGAGADSVIIEETTTTYTEHEFWTQDTWRIMSLTIKEVG